MENRINLQELDHKMLLLGFRENLSGTAMLRQAIMDWEPGMSATRELYPIVARKCGSTPCRVERAMRHAIETAFERGSNDTIMGLFGYSLSPEKGKPTVSEFVARMARVCSDGEY